MACCQSMIASLSSKADAYAIMQLQRQPMVTVTVTVTETYQTGLT